MNNQIQGQSSRPNGYDAEISLVDLAKILVKRWKAMAIIFTLIVLGALAYTLMVPRTYSYISLYEVAEQGPGSALEAPETLVAKTRNLYLGPETRKLLSTLDSEPEVLPFETSIGNPEKTLLVSLSTEAAESDMSLVEQLHNSVLVRLMDGQHARVEHRRKSLEQQISDAEESLDAIQVSNGTSLGSSEVIASLMDRVARLKNSLENIQEGEVLQAAVKSLEPTGIGRKLVLMLAVLLGGFLAVMGAFFMQFAELVRSSFND